MSTQCIWAQARAGRVPHVRLSGYCRFRGSAVELWLRNLEADSAMRRRAPHSRQLLLVGTSRTSDSSSVGEKMARWPLAQFATARNA